MRRWYIISTVIWLFFGRLSKRDSIRWILAAVVPLVLKFSRPFTNAIFVFYYVQPWVFLLLSNVNIQAKSHFAIFQVPGSQVIPGPQMIPDRKWSPNWTANDPGPEMISDRDRKWSRLKNKEWHGWWDGVDRELAYVNTDVFIKAILQL